MWPFNKKSEERAKAEAEKWEAIHKKEQAEMDKIEEMMKKVAGELSPLLETIRERCARVFTQESVNDYQTAVRFVKKWTNPEIWDVGDVYYNRSSVVHHLYIFEKYLILQEDAEARKVIESLEKEMKTVI